MEPTCQQARVDSIAFELRTTLSMCKNGLCGVHDLEPLLERMVGTSKDHYLGKARMMLDLGLVIGLDFRGLHAVPVAKVR